MSTTREMRRAVTPRQVEVARVLRKTVTPAEAVLWEALRSRRLDGLKFRRQHPVVGFIADFCCLEKRLVVEVDGPIHQEQREADAAREAMLREAGYRVLRFPNQMILDHLDRVLDTIRTAAFSPLHRDGEGAGG